MSESIGPQFFPRPATPSQLSVPVIAVGPYVVDDGGDRIAECVTPELAALVASLLNRDAGSR
jgi:hypothetical protein